MRPISPPAVYSSPASTVDVISTLFFEKRHSSDIGSRISKVTCTYLGFLSAWMSLIWPSTKSDSEIALISNLGTATNRLSLLIFY